MQACWLAGLQACKLTMQHRESSQLSPFLVVLQVKTVPDRSLVLPGDPGWSQDALEEPEKTPCGAPWETKGRPRASQGRQNDARAAPRATFLSILGMENYPKTAFSADFPPKEQISVGKNIRDRFSHDFGWIVHRNRYRNRLANRTRISKKLSSKQPSIDKASSSKPQKNLCFT